MLDELAEAIMQAGRDVRRNKQESKADPPPPESPGIIAVLPKKRLSAAGRRTLKVAITQNATCTRVE